MKTRFETLEDAAREQWFDRPPGISEDIKYWYPRMLNRFRHLSEIPEDANKGDFQSDVRRLFEATEEIESEAKKFS